MAKPEKKKKKLKPQTGPFKFLTEEEWRKTRRGKSRDLWESEIGSVKPGERAHTFDADVCFTAIFQGQKKGQKPHSVIWHVYSPHITTFTDARIQGTHNKVRWVKIKNNKKNWERDVDERRYLGENLIKALTHSGKHDSLYTEQMHPKAICGGIIDFLGQKVEGGRISALLIPGYRTLRQSQESEKEAEVAFNKMDEMLRGRMASGGLHKVITVSKRGGPIKGAGGVRIDEDGNIFMRDLVRSI